MIAGKEILVADDEAIIRKVLFEVLSGEGFRVTLAKDGQESLEQMAHHSFDLLITDINMPRLDGIGLLRRMKKDGRREKVILMTGSPKADSYNEKDLQSVFSLVQKPFRIQGLLSAVAAALAQSDGPGPISRN